MFAPSRLNAAASSAWSWVNLPVRVVPFRDRFQYGRIELFMDVNLRRAADDRLIEPGAMVPATLVWPRTRLIGLGSRPLV